MMKSLRTHHLLAALALIQSVEAFSPNIPRFGLEIRTNGVDRTSRQVWSAASSSSSSDDSSSSAPSSPVTAPPSPPPPILNGKRVLPYKIVMGALKGQKRVAAVYAVLDSSYRRGTEGWEAVAHVGVAPDLASTLQSLQESDATELRVAHVRALSFSFPEPNSMQSVAAEWRALAREAGADLDESWASAYLFDEDDDEDDDDEFGVDDLDAIVSPFDASKDTEIKTEVDDTPLEFTKENVDTILDEVRPYLIADGGNVALERVGTDDDKQVVLKLEGACGSCSSSTVTMQMGIERVLKEKWPDVTIAQVEDDAASQPTELSRQTVEEEVNRLKPALIAMGSAVELLDVHPETGVVEVKFQGGSKVRSGLELAIADLPFVTEVKFVDNE